MNQEDLIKKNDLLSQISALKASLKVLKLDEKKNGAGIKSTEAVLKETEDKLKKFEDEIVNKHKLEIEAEQKRRQKEVKGEFKFLNEYLKHISSLKVGERPDENMAKQFINIKRHPHIMRELRLRHLIR